MTEPDFSLVRFLLCSYFDSILSPVCSGSCRLFYCTVIIQFHHRTGVGQFPIFEESDDGERWRPDHCCVHCFELPSLPVL